MSMVTVVTQAISKTHGGILSSTSMTREMGTGLIANQRNADQSGSFIPGVYKVTPFSALTRTVHPSPTSDPGENREVFIRDIPSQNYYTVKTYSGDIGLAGYTSATAAFNNCVKLTDLTVTSLKQEALLRAYGNVGDLAQLQLGTELGELRETWELLWKRILSIYKIRSNWKDFRSHLKTERDFFKKSTVKSLTSLPSKYMEFRYGWMPLMRSIEDVYKVFVEKLKLLSESERICTARGKTSRVKTATYGPVLNLYPNYCSASIETTCTVTCRAYVHYKVINTPGLSDLLGLSPKFIPETTWQLARLSFVWDWFLSLGSWLSAVRGYIDGDYKVLGNCTTVTIDGEGKSTLTESMTNKEFASHGIFYNKEVSRTINSPLPLPQIRFSNVLDIFKYLDLLFIATNFLPKQLRKDLKRDFTKGLLGTHKYTE